MKELRLFNPWRGIAATALVGAAAAIAVTFGVMAAFGFSINTLTMFGMVLAIGLLVDDAIVVVENVARVMEEDGLPPREATIKTMGQITGAGRRCARRFFGSYGIQAPTGMRVNWEPGCSEV